MKRLAAMFCILTGLSAFGQLPSRVLTSPVTPNRDVLDRLNLQLAWRTLLPVESRRDGVANIQHFGTDIFVQLRNGEILCIDPEDGHVRWSKRVSSPYPVARRLGYGNELVFVLDGSRVLSFERATGRQRWELELSQIPIAPPMAGELFLYIPFANGRVETYALPETISRVQKLDSAEKAKARQSLSDLRTKFRASLPSTSTGSDPRSAGVDTLRGRTVAPTNLERRSASSIGASTVNRAELRRLVQPGTEVPDRPTLVVSTSPGFRATFPANINAVGVLITGAERDGLLLRRDPEHPIFRFSTDTPMTMPPVDFGPTAYVTSTDSTVQSIDLAAGLVNWRYSAGSPINESPIATEDSIYLQTAHRGLIRVERKTGIAVWTQPEATRFQAVNDKFVYANDRFGNLMVLDRGTGTVLSRYDLSAYNVVFPNYQTDRVVLAANDGSLLSLHDQGQSKPLMHRPTLPKPKLPGDKTADDKAGK